MAMAQETQADRQWTDLEFPSHPNSLALFAIAHKNGKWEKYSFLIR